MIEVNESNTQDVNRPFPNLVPTEILVFCLYLRSLTPKKVSLQNRVILHITSNATAKHPIKLRL